MRQEDVRELIAQLRDDHAALSSTYDALLRRYKTLPIGEVLDSYGGGGGASGEREQVAAELRAILRQMEEKVGCRVVRVCCCLCCMDLAHYVLRVH